MRGFFTDTIQYTSGSSPVAIAVADFNEDNRLDLVVANELSENVAILLNSYL